MEVAEIRQKISEKSREARELREVSLTQISFEEDIALLENRMTQPDFWNDKYCSSKDLTRVK